MFFQKNLIVRPLIEISSQTHTYLIWDKLTNEAVIIDPVRETLERDKRLIKELGLKLAWILETHIHADHITSAGPLQNEFDAKIGVSIHGDITHPRIESLSEGMTIIINDDFKLSVLETPGHTSCSLSFHLSHFIFTGDALLIRGCGRTDFQGGSSDILYKTIHQKLFTLDDDTLVLPGHNYSGELVSTIREEKTFNPRLNLQVTQKEFSAIMDNLKLAPPLKIDISIPGNKKCGL